MKILKLRGGTGSGNFGHSGRPGKVGGSSSFIQSSPPPKIKTGTFQQKTFKIDTSVLKFGNPDSTPFTNNYQSYNDLFRDLISWNPNAYENPTMWRSISNFELNSILETGEIQSTNAMSFSNQKGHTFYDAYPSRMYAEDNFNPNVVKIIQEVHPNFPSPKLGDSAYLIEVYKPSDIRLNSSKEYFTTHPLSSSNIKRIIEARPGAMGDDGYFHAFGYKDVTSQFNIFRGGKGSGNFGHSGRPGEVGGSSSMYSFPSEETLNEISTKLQETGKDIFKRLYRKSQFRTSENFHSEVLRSWDKSTNIYSLLGTFEIQGTNFSSSVISVGEFESLEGELGLEINGIIHNHSGTSIIGRFSRIIYPDSIVYNELFSLEPKFRKHGIGLQFYKETELNLISSKTKSIRLLANSKVGGYAWARMGFDFEKNYDLEGYNNLYQEAKTKWNKLSPDIPFPLTTKFHSWELATLQHPTNPEFGKNILLGSGWYGFKDLSPDSLSYQIGQAYYESKTNSQKK